MSKLSTYTIGLAGVQWFFFIFANIVVVPISIGAAFHLPPEEVAASLQRSFIITGAASVLQAAIGHRYSLMEGHSGLWWGLMLSICASAPSAGMSLTAVGGGFATGILLAGAVTIILGALNFGSVLKRIFTPMVMSVYLFLLSSQLIIIFFKGMMGISDGKHLDFRVSLLSICIAFLVGWVNLKGCGAVSNFSILIGMIVGWVAYDSLFPGHVPVPEANASTLTLFPWGTPNLEYGIILISFIAGLINMSNTITAVSTAEILYKMKTSDGHYKVSFMLTGIYSVVSALLGLVPYGPYSSSIGFLESTRILNRAVFIIGGGLVMLLGLVPSWGVFLSTMPVTVGNAVLLVAYLQLFGAALRNINEVLFNSRTIYRIAAPTLLGISIMNISPEAFVELPVLIRPLVSNGLIMGVIFSVFLESFVNWQSYEVTN
ncbi:uracil/xanthine transporter [Paenibacillus sp. GP183]|jgi:xanthine/uracil permease|uniref:uracil/xanthine transporter n=1 Tax=Paenibacillus sp. GP183 TaxID=1882751 RepID=UPI00089D19ED|nr:uracil/xanthine transporter [Paenibacillus sp. GP183]SEC13173.1 Xanthine/uracil permease [Paenibacillus sp. GP183]